ncbi:MAG: DUF5658 family protein [Kiloniellales bacterium]|jgi:hypothetical protein
MFFDLPRRIAIRARNNGQLVRWGRRLAIAIVILGGLDLFSTNAALAAGQMEGNLLVRSLQTALGSAWAVPKMAFHLALAYLVLWMPSKRMLATGAVVSAAYVLLVLNNFYLAGSPL